MVVPPPPPGGCKPEETISFFVLVVEISCILVLSHFFHLILKPLGQPGPIAQLLAGLVLGPSGLSHFKSIREYLFQDAASEYYQAIATFTRIIFMFLIGLEMDVAYLLRTIRLSSGVAGGGCLLCCVFGAIVSPVLYNLTHAHGDKFKFALTLILLLANTASPVVIRMAAELKLATSEVGRLAISSSLINDIWCLLGVAVMNTWVKGSLNIPERIAGCFLSVILFGFVVFLNRQLSRLLNKRNRHRKYITNMQLITIVLISLSASMFTELMGFNSMITCFFFGLFFPREGKTGRTLLHKLTYPVNNFVLPIYFGYTGFQADLTQVRGFNNIITVVIVVLLSVGGKIGGTLGACHYLKIPFDEGIILGLFLNLKGHVDLLVISLATQRHRWNTVVYNVFLATVVINSVIVGPAVKYIVRRERKKVEFKQRGVEWVDPDGELRMLACVHGPRYVPTMAGVIGATSGANRTLISPYLLHLVEFTDKNKTQMLYHQQEEHDLSDDEEYGGNDALEINDAVDAFFSETRILVRQLTVVSPFKTMYKDVCRSAEGLRVSILILPFHKYLRIDGKMENGKEGVRITNQKVLRHAPCSVGILVDRGFTSPVPLSGEEGVDTRHQICALFFGGPDDREALAYGCRMADHINVNLTVFRFMPASKKQITEGIVFASGGDKEVLMSVSDTNAQNDVDEAFLSAFYNRYVTSAKVGFVEKYVENGTGTVAILSDIGDMYGLFIVGKGGRGFSPLTTGMSDWEECPELGAIGDLLASSDFSVKGSVLVIQQHRQPQKDVTDD